MSRTIKIGVVGARRGASFARGAGRHLGMELVALCDTWEQRLEQAGREFGVATYVEFEKFLEHDMDAVVLANYFHEHAPLAVKALAAGKHVMSETTACKTLGEAVALVRAVEKSGRTYMFAENYCFFVYNQEMRRLYRAGEIGDLQFGECEYVHPMDAAATAELAPGVNHWRNWLPSTYYCTHALGPMMYITGTRPVSVNAHSIARSPADSLRRLLARRSDPGSTILCRMDNGAMVHALGLMLRGHSIWYRLHGTRGLMENLRTKGQENKLRVVHEEWDRRAGDVAEKIYTPEFPVHAERARKAGHGGGDFFTNYFFAEAIRKNEPPILDVYRGLDMSIVGIQAWKSALDGGRPYEIPDFRTEAARRKYAKEDWSPWPQDAAAGQPPPSIRGTVPPPKQALAFARKVWKKMGYRGEGRDKA